MPRAIVLALLLGLFAPQVAFAAKVPDLRGKTVAQAARALSALVCNLRRANGCSS